MKFGLYVSLLAFLFVSAHSHSEQDNGLYLGVGIFGAANSTCEYSDCVYSGNVFEVGYDFNKIVSLEGKYAAGESSNSYDEADLTISYLGVNVGSDFGTGWFRLYGKAGVASISEDESYYYDSYSESGVTFGLGARFTLTGLAKGVYIKTETLGVTFQDDSVGYAFSGGIGYRF